MPSDLQLYQRLNGELVSMVDHFNNLVRATREGLEADDSRGVSGAAGGRERRVPGELLEVLVEKLLTAGHQCVHTVSELKKGAMVSDFNSLMANVQTLADRLDKQQKDSLENLETIKTDAQRLLAALEQHYYGSAHKGKLPSSEIEAGNSKLAELCAQALQMTEG